MINVRRHSKIFALYLLIVFLRPLVSGSGLDYFGSRAALDFLLHLSTIIMVTFIIFDRNRKNISFPAPIFAVILWLGWAAVSAIVSWKGGRSIFVSFQRLDVYFSIFLLGILSATLNESDEEKETAVSTLAASGMLAALYGLYQYFIGFGSSADFVRNYGSFDMINADSASRVLLARRIFSTTFSPDMFAGMMAVMVLAAGGLVFRAREKGDKQQTAYGALAVILCAAALFLSGSLGGWLALAAGGTIFLLNGLSENRKHFVIGAAVILLILAASAGIVSRRAKTFIDFEHPSNPIVQRLNYWQGGMNVFFNDPITGVGPAHYGSAYLKIKPEKAGETRYAHNAVVQYLSEIGLPGAVGYIWILVFFVIGAAKVSKGDPLKQGIMAAGCAFIAHSMIDFDTEIIEVAALFWILAGLTSDRKIALDARKGKIFKAIFASVLCIFGIFDISTAAGGFYMEQAGRAYENGDSKSAIENLERSRLFRILDPKQAELEAKIFMDIKGGLPNAEAALNRLVAIDASDSQSYMKLGSFYLNIGNYESAVPAFEKAVQLFPSFETARAMLHFTRANLLVRKNDYEGAKLELEKVLVYFPNHKGALEGLEFIKQKWTENR